MCHLPSVRWVPISDTSFRCSFNVLHRSYDTNPEISQILGFRVIKVSWDQKAPKDGMIHTDRWVADHLGCFALKEEASFDVSSLGSNKNILEVVSVQLGTPDPKYFQVPLNYKERTPSELFAEEAKRRGDLKCTKCDTAASNIVDQMRSRSRALPFTVMASPLR